MGSHDRSLQPARERSFDACNSTLSSRRVSPHSVENSAATLMSLFSLSPNRRRNAPEPAFASIERPDEAETPAAGGSLSSGFDSCPPGARTAASGIRFNFEKTAGEDMGVIFGFAPGVFAAVVVRIVKQSSRLQGSIFEGDVVTEVNGTKVCDPAKASSLLNAAAGDVFLCVKAAGSNAALPSMPDRSYPYRVHGQSSATSDK